MNNKPTSLRRQEASRANGAKSKGPITPEGKARSSRNAVKHGCLASWATLNEEDEQTLTQIYENYVARFEPRDQAEYDLVEQIVYWNFRMRQTWMQITATVGIQIMRDREKVDREWHSPSDIDRSALAFAESVKDSPTLPLLERYSRGFASQAQRATKQLLDLQKLRLPPAPAITAPGTSQELPNDPSPKSNTCKPSRLSLPQAPSRESFLTRPPSARCAGVSGPLTFSPANACLPILPNVTVTHLSARRVSQALLVIFSNEFFTGIEGAL